MARGESDVELSGDVELVVSGRDEDELEEALERLDPEIFLLAAGDATSRSSTCSSCSPTFPRASSRSRTSASATQDEMAELERAGFDAVLVRSAA